MNLAFRVFPLVVASTLVTACSSNDAVSPTADASTGHAAPSAEAGADAADGGADATDAAPVPSCAEGALLDAGLAPTPDAGSGAGDAGDAGGDGGTRAPDAKVVVVNASVTLASMRVCFATGAKADGSDAIVAPLPALPDHGGSPYPGVPRGSGGPLPDFVDLSKLALTVYAVDASTIGGEVSSNPNEKTCDELLGAQGNGGTLVLGRDYFKLATLPTGTFAPKTTVLVGARDCDAASPQAGCAAGAKMGLLTAKLDRSPPPAAGLAVQVASFATKLGSVDAFFGCTPFASDVALGDVSPASASPLSDFAARFSVRSGAYLSPPMPLPVIQSIAPLPMQLGTSTTFVILGDPGAPAATLPDGSSNPQYDGRGVHALAIPNDPPLPRF